MDLNGPWLRKLLNVQRVCFPTNLRLSISRLHGAAEDLTDGLPEKRIPDWLRQMGAYNCIQVYKLYTVPQETYSQMFESWVFLQLEPKYQIVAYFGPITVRWEGTALAQWSYRFGQPRQHLGKSLGVLPLPISQSQHSKSSMLQDDVHFSCGIVIIMMN